MNIQRYPLGQLQANCYLLIEGNHCIVLDPGDSADFISETIARQNLVLDAIIATHGHFDHVMAVGELQALLGTQVPFYIHEKDLFLLERLRSTAEHFLEHKPIVIEPKNIKKLEKGYPIDGWELNVIPTPGHTPGSCSLFFEKERALFTGDTLFKDGIGRYDFSYSNKELLKQSLEKLFSLEGVITVYPGHGEETFLNIEQGRAMSNLV